MEDDLVKNDFDPKNFVSVKWRAYGDDVRKLKDLRHQIQSLADESAQVVKKNVFQNYTQFIETAKEISHLESETYQLSHLLGEQKMLIESMMELSLIGIKDRTNDVSFNGASKATTSTQVVQQILEKVENCSNLVDNPSRELLLESDLVELNFETCSPVRHIRAFLFTDGIMFVSPLSHSPGELFRYSFDSFYQLENLALINVREESSSATTTSYSNAIFKLLVFPDHKLFQCENARLKKKWMDTVESAKKRMIREGSLMRQATIRLKKQFDAKKTTDEQRTAASTATSESALKFAAEMEYLRELPDELDACIVQRDFDNAVDIMQEGRDSLADCPDAGFAREMSEKLDLKHQQLVDVLCKELKVGVGAGTEKNFQGGPKAARKAMTLLNRLGKSSQACDLYLKNRTAYIRHNVKELKLADNPLHYVTDLTKIVCKNLLDVGREFLRFFSLNPSCFAVYSVWASGELKHYVNHLVRQIFDSAPSLQVFGRCIRLAYSSFEDLASIGLDLSFELDNLLHVHVCNIIRDNQRNFIEALNVRISEDKWRPYNMKSEANSVKFLEDMNDIGINVDRYVCASERCFLWLTNQICQFARNILPFTRELAQLRVGPYVELCDSTLQAIWHLELAHMSNSAGKCNKDVFERNCSFLLNHLVPLCNGTYRKGSSSSGCAVRFSLLDDAVAKYSALHVYSTPAEAGSRAENAVSQFETIGDV